MRDTNIAVRFFIMFG